MARAALDAVVLFSQLKALPVVAEHFIDGARAAAAATECSMQVLLCSVKAMAFIVRAVTVANMGRPVFEERALQLGRLRTRADLQLQLLRCQETLVQKRVALAVEVECMQLRGWQLQEQLSIGRATHAPSAANPLRLVKHATDQTERFSATNVMPGDLVCTVTALVGWGVFQL